MDNKLDRNSIWGFSPLSIFFYEVEDYSSKSSNLVFKDPKLWFDFSLLCNIWEKVHSGQNISNYWVLLQSFSMQIMQSISWCSLILHFIDGIHLINLSFISLITFFILPIWRNKYVDLYSIIYLYFNKILFILFFIYLEINYYIIMHILLITKKLSQKLKFIVVSF